MDKRLIQLFDAVAVLDSLILFSKSFILFSKKTLFFWRLLSLDFISLMFELNKT